MKNLTENSPQKDWVRYEDNHRLDKLINSISYSTPLQQF